MGTKDRKILEKENRREKILIAAEIIMTTRGIHGLNIDLIAEETQLAKGTIYLYFKSKEEILSYLSIKSRKLLFQEFKKIELMDINPIEKLKEVVKVNYIFYKNTPLYYDLVSLYEVNNTFNETEEMHESTQDIANLIINIANKAQENGSLNPNINPLHFSFCMWGMTVGMFQLMKVRGAIMSEKMNISENDLLTTFIESLECGIVSKH
jgi:TetR/AcrR family transcriptional regulator